MLLKNPQTCSHCKVLGVYDTKVCLLRRPLPGHMLGMDGSEFARGISGEWRYGSLDKQNQ